MEIKLNVTEEKFNEVLQKELDAFSREEIKDIIRSCIEKRLMEDDNIKNLLVYKDHWHGDQPSIIMQQAAEKIDLSPAYKEIQDKMISYMKENYQDVMVKIMSDLMVKGLIDNYGFREAVQSAITEELYRRSSS